MGVSCPAAIVSYSALVATDSSVSYIHTTANFEIITADDGTSQYTFNYTEQSDEFKQLLIDQGWAGLGEPWSRNTMLPTGMSTSSQSYRATTYQLIAYDSSINDIYYNKTYTVPDQLTSAITDGQTIYFHMYGLHSLCLYNGLSTSESYQTSISADYATLLGVSSDMSGLLRDDWTVSDLITHIARVTDVGATLSSRLATTPENFRLAHINTSASLDVLGYAFCSQYSSRCDRLFYIAPDPNIVDDELQDYVQCTDPQVRIYEMLVSDFFAEFGTNISIQLVVKRTDILYMLWYSNPRYPDRGMCCNYRYLQTDYFAYDNLYQNVSSMLTTDYILGDNPEGTALIQYPEHRTVDDVVHLVAYDSTNNPYATDTTIPLNASTITTEIKAAIDEGLSLYDPYESIRTIHKTVPGASGGTLPAYNVISIEKTYYLQVAGWFPYEEYLVSAYTLADLVDSCGQIQDSSMLGDGTDSLYSVSDSMYDFSRYRYVQLLNTCVAFPISTTIEQILNRFKSERQYQYSSSGWINCSRTVIRHDKRAGTDYAYVYVIDNLEALGQMSSASAGRVTETVYMQDDSGLETESYVDGTLNCIYRCKVMTSNISWSGGIRSVTHTEVPLSATLDDCRYRIWLEPVAAE